MTEGSGLRRVSLPLGDRSYNILIQSGIFSHLGEHMARVGLTGRVAIVTNEKVTKLYGRTVERALKRSGFSSHVIVIPDGERAKSIRWLSKILDELVANRFERQDCLLALGGGVVGDAAGFAAAVYLRGIPFVQVPTTLVSQVDSSVGGKTGVNHPQGKNLIGAFYQPKLVLIDPLSLRTLPSREWVAGLAEVIKYGMIADRAFFEYLEGNLEGLRTQDEDVVSQVIRRCCEIKAEVVADDERESGRRRILNYGHTVGHVLEAIGKYQKWIHGEAVGIGMAQEASIGNFLGMCGKGVVERQRTLIREVGLPIDLPGMTFSDLWDSMLHDKKVHKGNIHCVIPQTIGKVQVIPLKRSAIRQWFSTHHRNSSTRSAAKTPSRSRMR